MMKHTLQLRLSQQLKLTPQLQQAIKLLQLSKLDLEQTISEALESNPMLEVEEVESSTENEAEIPDIVVDSSWEDTYPDIQPVNYSVGESYNIETSYSKDQSLQDYLEWQLNLTPMSERDKIIGLVIIDAITDAGYLGASLEEIKDGCNYLEDLELNEIEMMLHRIQRFDPLGVGSRNLQECLTIQLSYLEQDTPYLSITKKAVTHYIELIGKKNIKRLRSRMEIDEATANGILSLLKSLNPIPGQGLFSVKADYIIPDLVVKQCEGQWLIELNRDNSSHLRINPSYAAMVQRADNSRDNKFLQEQLTEAKWFLKSLQNRNETLLKVGTAIMAYQSKFLEQGEEHMRPLILSSIAQELDLHESTVSRITTNKYIHTPRGVFELKYFFSSHISDKDGKDLSSTAIKAFIKNIISTEDKTATFSDSQITKMLSDKGIEVARRTVAKYREAMGIPPSNERKL